MRGIPSCLAFTVMSAVILAGCADTTAYYAPPSDLTPDKAVSLVGTKDPKFFLQSSEYRLVWAVDGEPVKDSAYRWSQPLLITANEPHRLDLGYGWGAVAGGTEVEFTGKPGTTVLVKGENLNPDSLANLWLEDAATGQIIGEKREVRLYYTSDPNVALLAPSGDVIGIKSITKPSLNPSIGVRP
jgi:hypothetical protein